MKKALLCISLLVCLIFVMSGCELVDAAKDAISGVSSGSSGDSGGNSNLEAMTQLTENVTYHTTYLGVTNTLPKGWWTYDIDSNNVSTDPELTDDRATLAIDFSTDSENEYMYLLGISNTNDSNRGNYTSLSFEAEKFESFPTADDLSLYAEDYVEYLELPYEDGTPGWEFVEMSIETINDKQWAISYLYSPETDDYYAASMIYASTAVNDGYFLNIFMYYYPENTSAESSLRKHIEKNLVFNVQ